MHEGMYLFTFAGTSGQGLGVMVLQSGIAYGTDGGIRYDGTYVPHLSGEAVVSLKLSVPPGTALVQGVPAQPMEYSFDLTLTIKLGGITPLKIQTPFGPVNATVSYLRPLPHQLAA